MKSFTQYLNEAEYQGKKVTLDKPRPNTGKGGQWEVFVKDGDKIKRVTFGQAGKGNRIGKGNKDRKKSFCARHNCDDPGPKTKARYWACKDWEC